jgi:hypothetical protein
LFGIHPELELDQTYSFIIRRNPFEYHLKVTAVVLVDSGAERLPSFEPVRDYRRIYSVFTWSVYDALGRYGSRTVPTGFPIFEKTLVYL